MNDEATRKIALLEAQIEKLEEKLRLANELNLKLFKDYKTASRQLQALEQALSKEG